MDQIARDSATHNDSIVALLSRAVADAQDMVRAEIELQAARVLVKIDEGRNAVVFAVVALVLGSMALTALVVGALMILASLLGPIWATVIVGGLLGGAAALFGWLSLRQFMLMFGKGGKQQ